MRRRMCHSRQQAQHMQRPWGGNKLGISSNIRKSVWWWVSSEGDRGERRPERRGPLMRHGKSFGRSVKTTFFLSSDHSPTSYSRVHTESWQSHLLPQAAPLRSLTSRGLTRFLCLASLPHPAPSWLILGAQKPQPQRTLSDPQVGVRLLVHPHHRAGLAWLDLLVSPWGTEWMLQNS